MFEAPWSPMIGWMEAVSAPALTWRRLGRGTAQTMRMFAITKGTDPQAVTISDIILLTQQCTRLAVLGMIL